MGQEKGEKFMSYLNSVTIIGFVGADPEQRQARNNNGSKFTVLSVATQRSWKNTDERSSPTPLIRLALSCNWNGDQAGALFLRWSKSIGTIPIWTSTTSASSIKPTRSSHER